MLNKILMSALILGLAAGYAQDDKKAAPKADPKALAHTVDVTKFDLDEGKKLFEANCALCHGATGHGDGAGAAALNPKPRDLSNAAYINTRTWKELRDVVAQGGANSGMSALMPAWLGALKRPQIENVLAYVLTLSRIEEGADAKAAKPAAKATEKAPAKK